MNTDSHSGKAIDILTILARWGLGILFIYMGFSKVLHPEQFLKLVREYDMVSNPLLLNTIAATLPWFEVFCGILLLCGIAVRGSALLVALMLIPFSLLVLLRALDISEDAGLPFCSVKFDCGCGGGEVFICRKLIENSLMLLGSLWLLAGHGRQAALKFCLWRP
ncbi:MAG TPA: MauE/DoxX family redox-associated membrane protein [Clostridia bacterium]|nr:MauE/DoxX family redox-associated membrane protein [Clostridia bacterium]